MIVYTKVLYVKHCRCINEVMTSGCNLLQTLEVACIEQVKRGDLVLALDFIGRCMMWWHGLRQSWGWATDDDSEVLFLMRKSSTKGWRVMPVDIQQPKFDLTQFQLEQPINRLVRGRRGYCSGWGFNIRSRQTCYICCKTDSLHWTLCTPR